MKKSLLILILLLLVSMVVSSSVYASTTTLSVDPPSIIDTGLTPGKNFTINVNVANVTDLYTFDFFLNYTTAVLTATKITLGSFFPSNARVWKKVTNDTLGYVRYMVSLPLGTPQGGGKNGSGTLAIINFTVDSSGESLLDLCNTKLSNSYAEYIDHDVYDGYFRNAELIHDVAVISITAPSKGFVGFPVSINVTVKNEGTFRETVNLTLKYGTTRIGNKTLDILSGLSEVARFTWNTTGVTPSNYNLTATATVLKSTWNPAGIDDDLADNSKIKTILIVVWIPGDGDLDGVVDMDDFYVWREYFGKSTGEWPSSVKPDYDSSGFVDMYDFYTWREHFGESDP